MTELIVELINNSSTKKKNNNPDKYLVVGNYKHLNWYVS